MNSDEGRDAKDAGRPISVALSDPAVAALQLVRAEIRFRSGTAMTASAIVRALVGWMAELDLDTRGISSAEDFRRALAHAAPAARPAGRECGR